MIRPILLDSIPALARDIYNRVYAKKYRCSFLLDDEKGCFYFYYNVKLTSPCIVICLKYNDEDILIIFDKDVLNFISNYYGVDISLLEEEIKIGMIQVIWNKMVSSNSQLISAEVYNIRYVENYKSILHSCYLPFVLKFSSYSFELAGILSASESLVVQYIDRLMSIMEIEEEESLLDYPCPVEILIGYTRITLKELSCVEKNDILLIERFYFSQKGLILKAGPYSFEAEMKEGKIVVNNMVKEVHMSEESGENKKIDVNEIPVVLSFSLGRMEINFGELKEIQPGYIFSLDKPIGTYVEVLANGRLLGRGELVEIEGKVGVRLKEINSDLGYFPQESQTLQRDS